MNGFSELYIYKDCEILKNKNFKVDNIQDYLGTLFNFHALNKTNAQNKLIPINAQFFKHGLKTSVVVELKQTRLDDLAPNKRAQELTNFYDSNNFNYMAVRNCDERTQGNYLKFEYVYYFIVGKKWASENSILFELEMDVINTLIDNTEDGAEPLILSPKTTIIRQHKDRWKKGTQPNKMYFPIVDLYSEGITPPLFKVSEKNAYALKDNSVIDENSYYLVYVASEEGTSKPIDIYLVADETIVVNQDWTYWSGTFNAQSELRTRYGAIIYGNDGVGSLTNVGCSITGKLNSTPKQEITYTITASNQAILICNNYFTIGTIGNNGFTRTGSIVNMSLSDRKKITISGLAKMRVCNRSDLPVAVNIPAITESFILNCPVASEYAPSQDGPAEVISINDVDRTQGRIAKIVKLPYCPINLGYTLDGLVNLPSDWDVQTWPLDTYFKAIHYRFRNSPSCFVSEHFLDSENYDLTGPSSVIAQRKIDAFGEVVARDKSYEPKLYHSDYFINKFVYDSFAYNFRCEFMDDVDGGEAPYVKMATTSSMTSNFFFTFPTVQYKIDVDDYSKIMMVARNNDVILYNSSYLDYIRNGYNFDKKTRNRNLGLSIASLSLGVVGDVAGMVAGWKESSKAEKIAGVVQEVAKTANSAIRIAGQTAQADQNIEQKLRMSLYQGVSVAGSDDMDLLSEYATDNKPKMITYKVSEKMEKTLFDLFYYTGYVANFQGEPDTSSRMWFNFVMAEPVYYYEQSFPQELLEELNNKFREGITFLHKVVIYENEEPIERWDFDQQYENWENSVLPIPRIRELYSVSSMQARREYVIKSDLSSITSLGYLLNAGKLTWRKRRKSDLKVIDEITELDQYRINGSSINVIKGSTIYKTCTYSTYANADYYWTIEFSENTSSGEHQENAYSSIMGYIEYI